MLATAIRLIALGFLAAGSACAPAAVSARPSLAADPEAAWRRLLAEAVDARGFIASQALERDGGDLDAFLDWVARTDATSRPDLFADRDGRLAFHLNAYLALVFEGYRRNCAIRHSWDSILRHEVFTVGGRSLTLRTYEDEVIRPLGDRRAFFALRSPFWMGPRLPREPFRAATLDATLDALARESLTDPRNVAVHVSGTRANLSPLLREFVTLWLAGESDFVTFCDGYRPLPRGCKVEFGTRWGVLAHLHLREGHR